MLQSINQFASSFPAFSLVIAAIFAWLLFRYCVEIFWLAVIAYTMPPIGILRLFKVRTMLLPIFIPYSILFWGIVWVVIHFILKFW